MSKDINTLLKEATKDLLTEESLNAIAEAVEKKAEEKAQLAVESALIKQDEEYASKLEKVLEAIDADHTAKLDKIVARIDETHAVKFKHALNVLDSDRTAKLQKVVEIYENALNQEAVNFKNTLVDQISNFIDLYIDKTIPAQQIQEATENVRSRKIVNEVKRLVGLSDAFVNENVKEALVDGKKQIDEANARAAELEKQYKLITEKTQNLEKQLFLEKKLVSFPPAKKEYMMRVLSEKKLEVINENFNYVSEMYDKKETEELSSLKESAKPKSKNVDVSIPDELINESKSFSTADDEGATFVAKAYVSEFTKKSY